MINTGIRNSNKDWNLILLSGKNYKDNFLRKVQIFQKFDNDIFFPIDLKNMNFFETKFEWLFLNKNYFIKFNEDCSFEESKLIWSYENQNVNFKGLIP